MTATQIPSSSDRGIRVTNYGNVFLSCSTEGGCECRFKVVDHLLIYVRSGEAEIEDRGKRTVLSAGECAFIRRHAGVQLVKRSVGEQPYMSITLNFPRKFLMQVYASLPKDRIPERARRGKNNVIRIAPRPDTVSLFESLMPYYNAQQEPDNEWIAGKLGEGLQVVLRTNANLYASLFDFTEPWKIDILDYLNENYMYELSLADIARYTGRSLATFKRDFKKISDLTPEKWLIRRRLAAAHELLSQEPYQPRLVQEVMQRVGFGNLSHFSRAYKETYGYAPSQTV